MREGRREESRREGGREEGAGPLLVSCPFFFLPLYCFFEVSYNHGVAFASPYDRLGVA